MRLLALGHQLAFIAHQVATHRRLRGNHVPMHPARRQAVRARSILGDARLNGIELLPRLCVGIRHRCWQRTVACHRVIDFDAF